MNYTRWYVLMGTCTPLAHVLLFCATVVRFVLLEVSPRPTAWTASLWLIRYLSPTSWRNSRNLYACNFTGLLDCDSYWDRCGWFMIRMVVPKVGNVDSEWSLCLWFCCVSTVYCFNCIWYSICRHSEICAVAWVELLSLADRSTHERKFGANGQNFMELSLWVWLICQSLLSPNHGCFDDISAKLYSNSPARRSELMSVLSFLDSTCASRKRKWVWIVVMQTSWIVPWHVLNYSVVCAFTIRKRMCCIHCIWKQGRTGRIPWFHVFCMEQILNATELSPKKKNDECPKCTYIYITI